MHMPTLSLGAALALFSTQVMARKCHLSTVVSHRQNSACGAESCIPGDSFSGTGVLTIDGDKSWNGDGASYDNLSNGDGVDVDQDGVSFHIDALGMPDVVSEPTCSIHIPPDYNNLGIGRTESIGDPGVVGNELYCEHDWNC